ncbi:MAG: 1,4-dihydroxy-2-naphthoate polyprenyltransferase [Deltaproteobacteria bacterium]|nr:1,4-dihydroxy-2-naphthoate polyprenyltransferase [Deltaproteobacteria bacterium]
MFPLVGKVIGKLRVWSLAVRPRTLPAAVSPVLLGAAAAFADECFRCLPALAALLGAILLQIGVNLANDYFDCVKGVDTGDRLGPPRVTQSGLIPADRVMTAMVAAFLFAAGVGLYLTAVAGWPVLAVGVASILAALLYSSGPFPLANHGLGDFFAFFFFGPVAVCGTYYVQVLHVSLLCAILSLPVGFLVAAILVVNNLRDIPTDAKAGKRTMAVILGPRWARREFLLLLAAAYGLIVLLWLLGRLSTWGLLPLLTVPTAASLVRSLGVLSGSALNEALANTARLALLFSALLSLGLAIPIL